MEVEMASEQWHASCVGDLVAQLLYDSVLRVADIVSGSWSASVPAGHTTCDRFFRGS